MKFNLLCLPTVPATPEERERLRPIERNNPKYQEALHERRKIAVLADALGFDALSTTEHHSHSEGFEVSVAPLPRYTDLAAFTNNIKFESLGFGFLKAFRFPGETTPVPNGCNRLLEARGAHAGTVDDIKLQLDVLRENVNVEWFASYFDQRLMPLDGAKRQLELFATKSMPEFKDRPS